MLFNYREWDDNKLLARLLLRKKLYWDGETDVEVKNRIEDLTIELLVYLYPEEARKVLKESENWWNDKLNDL